MTSAASLLDQRRYFLTVQAGDGILIMDFRFWIEVPFWAFFTLFLNLKSKIQSRMGLNIFVERWPRGRRRLTRNQLYSYGYRGFESLPLRFCYNPCGTLYALIFYNIPSRQQKKAKRRSLLKESSLRPLKSAFRITRLLLCFSSYREGPELLLSYYGPFSRVLKLVLKPLLQSSHGPQTRNRLRRFCMIGLSLISPPWRKNHF
jgi:hypothetical protein